MVWKEEEMKLESRYRGLLDTEPLDKNQKRLVKELRKKLEGHLYDPQFLFDWVKNIPFEGIWDGYTDKKLLLRVVGVLEGMNDFYYLGYDQNAKLHLVLCNDTYEQSEKNTFLSKSREDMRKDIKNACSEYDRLLLFRPEKYDKELIS